MTSLKDFDYEDVKVVGRGQYGKAHLVRSKDQEYYIAKTIDLTCLSSKERETALQEVALLRRLDHANIVAYKDNFYMGETLVIIMQYCEGGDLQTYIKEKLKEKKRIQEAQIMHYFVQILHALQYIHGERILHRDLKTSNLFLMARREVVKLGDFGISRVLEGSIQSANTVVGTPYYMSPEVCENKPYTYKSDVWSLGCVLYELCMLKHAFSADNLLGLVYKIVSDKYEPIPKMYTPELNNLIQRMLDKGADRRPSVGNLLEDPYVQRFKNDWLRRQSAPGTSGGGAVAAPGTAGGHPRAPTSAGTSAVPAQPRSSGARTPGEERRPTARQGAAAAAAAAHKHNETPKEAMQRRKREAADREAAVAKSAAKEAAQNKLVVKQRKDIEFGATRPSSMRSVVSRGGPASPGGSTHVPSQAASSARSTSVPPEDGRHHEDDDEFEEDYEEEEYYEDDFEGDDESEEGEADEAKEQEAEEPHAAILEEAAVREAQDITRVRANYEQDISRPARGASPHRRASPSPPQAPPAVGGSVAAARAGKLKEELIHKMGKEVFEQAFEYLIQARKTDVPEKMVRKELEALVGKETYKKYGLDVDQVVFQHMHNAIM